MMLYDYLTLPPATHDLYLSNRPIQISPDVFSDPLDCDLTLSKTTSSFLSWFPGCTYLQSSFLHFSDFEHQDYTLVDATKVLGQCLPQK